MNFFLARSTSAALCLLVSISANADSAPATPGTMAMSRADGHAPIGVMADHVHKAGQWMFSYRYMYMDMQGNRVDGNNISANTIATSVPNRFFGRPMQPPTLRVVPTEMRMEMHMFGGMVAPSDRLTLMLMSSYVEKEMDHLTYRGPIGTTVRGTFTTKSSGIGDTRLTGMFKLSATKNHNLQLHLGGSIPTGTTTERDRVLTPFGTTPEVRLPYAMQIGSGTFDILTGLTYRGHYGNAGWGAQYAAIVRTGDNDGYTWGDRHDITGWLSYQPVSAISASVRMQYQTMGRIDGIDNAIVAPVQTADPDNYGGDRVNVLLGLNIAGQRDWMQRKRIALEVGIPIMQDLNGPQMETDLFVIASLQMAF